MFRCLCTERDPTLFYNKVLAQWQGCRVLISAVRVQSLTHGTVATCHMFLIKKKKNKVGMIKICNNKEKPPIVLKEKVN